jgi:hypothetical protein
MNERTNTQWMGAIFLKNRMVCPCITKADLQQKKSNKKTEDIQSASQRELKEKREGDPWYISHFKRWLHKMNFTGGWWRPQYVLNVRPHPEFSAQALAVWTGGTRNCLEKVQQRAVKMISRLKNNI